MSEALHLQPEATGPETVLASDPKGAEIVEKVTFAPRLNEDWENTRALLAKHVDKWENEPADFVRSLLQGRLFVDRAFLGKGIPDLIVKAIDGQHPISVPTDLLASTDSFESWAGRSEKHGKDWHSEAGHGTKPSINVIQHYASLATNPPAISELALYLQPDGKVLASGTHDGGHRLGAAILRGDPYVETYGLRVRYLDSNKV